MPERVLLHWVVANAMRMRLHRLLVHVAHGCGCCRRRRCRGR